MQNLGKGVCLFWWTECRDQLQWRIQVRGPASPLFLDQTEARRKLFPDHPPPYLRAWMTIPPPYLRVWIRHWINSFLRDNCRKFPTGEICGQSENNIYFSLPTCESRHIILSVWRLGGDLIHFFTDFYNFSLCYLFFTSPVYHIYALLKFSLGTWRKIGSVLSRFSLMPGADYMPDYLKKLNKKWSRRFSSLLHLLQSWLSTSYLRLKRILYVVVFSLISWLLLKTA